MNDRVNLVVVDADFRRRAAISHCLSGSQIHVEPFDGLDELVGRWPRDGLLLVHDEGQMVRQTIEAMGDNGEWMPLVAYAEAPGTSRIVQAVMNGAIDYLQWPFGEAEIRQALAVAEESRGVLGNTKLREAMARSRIQRLTKREREVLAGVADGLSNRLIGERLSISPRTVEIHRSNMLNKMGANHTSEAIRIAIEASLVG